MPSPKQTSGMPAATSIATDRPLAGRVIRRSSGSRGRIEMSDSAPASQLTMFRNRSRLPPKPERPVGGEVRVADHGQARLPLGGAGAIGLAASGAGAGASGASADRAAPIVIGPGLVALDFVHGHLSALLAASARSFFAKLCRLVSRKACGAARPGRDDDGLRGRERRDHVQRVHDGVRRVGGHDRHLGAADRGLAHHVEHDVAARRRSPIPAGTPAGWSAAARPRRCPAGRAGRASCRPCST